MVSLPWTKTGFICSSQPLFPRLTTGKDNTHLIGQTCEDSMKVHTLPKPQSLLKK